MSEATKQIVYLLSKIGAEVGPVGKAGYNEGQRYNFRGIDHIVNAAAAAFHKHQVVVTSQWLSVHDEPVESNKGASGYRVTGLVHFTFNAPDGSTLACTTRGEAIDYGDKASNKAHSAAKKYALVDVLCLPTDEPDADESSHDLAPRQYESKSDEPAVGIYQCPACGSQVYDNREANKDTKFPLWACSNSKCEGGSKRKKGTGNYPWGSYEWDAGDAGLIGPPPVREDYEAPEVPLPELRDEFGPDEAPF
jgi:hypothetical protein